MQRGGKRPNMTLTLSIISASRPRLYAYSMPKVCIAHPLLGQRCAIHAQPRNCSLRLPELPFCTMYIHVSHTLYNFRQGANKEQAGDHTITQG